MTPHDGTLKFSERTEGTQTYEKIFFDGNAVCNYFFFIDSNNISGVSGKAAGSYRQASRQGDQALHRGLGRRRQPHHRPKS